MVKINKAHAKKVDAVFAAVKNVAVFTIDAARKALASDGAYLSKFDNTKYTVHVHSNRWFYLYV